MYDEELKKALQTAVDHRLSGLSGNPFLAQRIIQREKGEQKVKKVSMSLVIALALMILTLSVGFALVKGGIIDHLYGNEENVPEAIVKQIEHPGETAQTSLGRIAVDEILYDGTALHTTITVENPMDETLLYTLDGISLNGERIMGTNILLDGAGYGGMLLGGTVEDTRLPASYSFYNKGEFLLSYDESGKFLGYTGIPEGEMTLTVDVAVWRPLNQPEIVDYRDYEGCNIDETRKNLAADVQGLCDLELFRPEAYYRSVAGKDVSSDVYAEAYKELGWAEKIDAISLSIPVTLNKNAVPHAVPELMEYDMDGVKIVFESFDFTQAGGEATGMMYGENSAVRALVTHGIEMVDPATDRVFTGGLIWDSDSQAKDGLHFSLRFMPFTGDMPESVLLAPVIRYDDRWVETSPNYDATVEKPENAVQCWVLDFDRAITMKLTHN